VTSLLDLRAAELLDRFASSEPAPGGGSAAALAGALAGALVEMVSGLEKTRTGAAEERARLDAARGWAREAGPRLRLLVEEDAQAYEAVVAAYKMPKATDEEKAARKEAIGRAMAHATVVPQQTAEACLVLLKAAQEAAENGNPNALSDARTAGALAWAGLRGAAENVRINAGSLGTSAEEALAQVEAAVAEGRARAQALGVA
jgi:formiminotetrahydrofolate cyclodeaminase